MKGHPRVLYLSLSMSYVGPSAPMCGGQWRSSGVWVVLVLVLWKSFSFRIPASSQLQLSWTFWASFKSRSLTLEILMLNGNKICHSASESYVWRRMMIKGESNGKDFVWTIHGPEVSVHVLAPLGFALTWVFTNSGKKETFYFCHSDTCMCDSNI